MRRVWIRYSYRERWEPRIHGNENLDRYISSALICFVSFCNSGVEPLDSATRTLVVMWCGQIHCPLRRSKSFLSKRTLNITQLERIVYLKRRRWLCVAVSIGIVWRESRVVTQAEGWLDRLLPACVGQKESWSSDVGRNIESLDSSKSPCRQRDTISLFPAKFKSLSSDFFMPKKIWRERN